MPINEHLMGELQKRYGAERGRSVYYALEAEGKGPFAAGNKLHPLHEAWASKNGVTPVRSKGKKKPRRSS